MAKSCHSRLRRAGQALLSACRRKSKGAVQDRHYVSRNSDMADAAARAILDWWEG